MSNLTSLDATISAFGGSALDNWAVQRAARQWGIFSRPAPSSHDDTNLLDGTLGADLTSIFSPAPQKILSAAHVESLTLKEYSTICTTPQENGSLASYNKVPNPYSATIRMLCDGSETGTLGENMLPGFLRGILGVGPDTVRKDFINTLARLVKDTSLYFIATPERIYPYANIVSYTFTRTSKKGVDLIAADITLQEIRQSQTSLWTYSRTPQGAQTHNNGIVTLQPGPTS